MKKSILFAGLLMVSALFIGCSNDGTPTTSKTKLWPAAVVSSSSNTRMQTIKWGFIDEKGSMVVPATYDAAYDFSCGFAKLVSFNAAGEPSYFFINEKQEMQTIPTNDELGNYFYYNFLTYKSGTLYGMFNNKFETAIQPAYRDLGEMSENGLVWFKQEDKYGYLNENGEPAIPVQYDDAFNFVDGVAVVKMGTNYGAIDKGGNQSVNYQANPLMSIGEDRLGFQDAQTGKFGMRETKGDKIIAQAMYDGYSPYGFTDEGLIAVKQGEKWGYIDKNRKDVLPAQFYEASPFFGGMAWIKRAEDANYEAINSKGTTLITLAKNEVPITFFRAGLCLVRVNLEASATSPVSGFEYKYIDEKGHAVYSWKWEGFDYYVAEPAGYATNININNNTGYDDYDDYDDYDQYSGDNDDYYYAAPAKRNPNKMNIHQLMAPTRYGNRVRK